MLLDLTQAGLEAELPRLLLPCEEVWWLMEPRFYATSSRNLRKLLAAEPRLAAQLRLVWIMDQGERFSPPPPEGLGASAANFKVILDDSPRMPSRAQAHSVERLVRRIRGARVGLALGGGGRERMARLRERAGMGAGRHQF